MVPQFPNALWQPSVVCTVNRSTTIPPKIAAAVSGVTSHARIAGCSTTRTIVAYHVTAVVAQTEFILATGNAVCCPSPTLATRRATIMFCRWAFRTFHRHSWVELFSCSESQLLCWEEWMMMRCGWCLLARQDLRMIV